MADVSDATNYEGLPGSRCEHRTVGAHRAWCHADGQWCYPSDPCPGCRDTLPGADVWIPDAGTAEEAALIDRIVARASRHIRTTRDVTTDVRDLAHDLAREQIRATLAALRAENT